MSGGGVGGGSAGGAGSAGRRVRVALPPHLRALVGAPSEIEVDVASSPPSISGVLDAVETLYPALRGTIRHHGAGARRPLMRFFAEGEDLSYGALDEPLPESVASGTETLLVVGAIAGG